MHEAGPMNTIINMAEKIAKENDAQQIMKIVLEVGEFGAVVPRYLEYYFDYYTSGKELFKDTVLEINIVEGIGRCLDCGEIFKIVENKGYCPKCNSFEKMVIEGRELLVKEIQVI